MPMPRRYIKQIPGADDRGGRKVASRSSQRAVARGVIRTLRGRAAATSDGGPGAVHELVDALRAHGDDRLGPLLEVLWPDGADGPVTPSAGLVQALGARDPGAAFDAAFSTLMEEGG